jgi:hypothetical protein
VSVLEQAAAAPSGGAARGSGSNAEPSSTTAAAAAAEASSAPAPAPAELDPRLTEHLVFGDMGGLPSPTAASSKGPSKEQGDAAGSGPGSGPGSDGPRSIEKVGGGTVACTLGSGWCWCCS